MARRWKIVTALLVLFLAAILRLSFLHWDNYNHYHPDERYISWVAASVELPDDLNTAFLPHESSFNPFYWPADPKPAGVLLIKDQPRSFAYGHVPLYLGVAANQLFSRIGQYVTEFLPDSWRLTQDILNGSGWIEYRHLTASGRALSALIDLTNVILIFFIGKWVYRPFVGLLAAALLAMNVMHIQLSHFYTVDPYLTFFVLLTLAFLIQAANRHHSHNRRVFLLFGAAFSIGLAVGSKFTGVLLLLPLSLVHAIGLNYPVSRKILILTAMLFVTFVSFFVTNPFAVLDATCEAGQPESIGPLRIPEIIRSSCYFKNVSSQGAMVRGTRDVPYVRQYDGTLPFLYYIEMQVKWGMGPALGLLAFSGFGWAIWRGLRGCGALLMAVRKSLNDDRSTSWANQRWPVEYCTKSEAVLLSWTLPFFISTGLLDVKFMRYLMPLTPFLMLYGAAMLMNWSKVGWRQMALGAVVTLTALYAVSFTNIYQEPHPWITASEWIYRNVQPGSFVLYEAWDDALPDAIELDGVNRSRDEYMSASVNWLSGTEEYDNLDKLRTNLELIAQSDFVILSSNRNYGVIPRLPGRYPLSSQYYPMLFDGRLGFEQVYAGSRIPNLFGIYLKPDYFSWPNLETPDITREYLDGLPGPNWGRVDESFTVYDQPMVQIFANRERLSSDELAKLFVD